MDNGDEVEVTRKVVIETRAISPEAISAGRVIYYILDIIEVLLVIRLILKFFGANPASGFVNFMYALTGPLVAPFTGIFPTISTAGAVFEWSTVIAMAIYALIAYALVRLFRAVFT